MRRHCALKSYRTADLHNHSFNFNSDRRLSIPWHRRHLHVIIHGASVEPNRVVVGPHERIGHGSV